MPAFGKLVPSTEMTKSLKLGFFRVIDMHQSSPVDFKIYIQIFMHFHNESDIFSQNCLNKEKLLYTGIPQVTNTDVLEMTHT